MSVDAEAIDQPPPRRRRRWRLALAVVTLLLLGAFGIAWMQRVQIAEGFLERELANRGVPARYVVKDIGFFRQRIENLSLGDPARPDLVAEWVDIDTGFTLSGPVVTGIRAGPLRMRGRLVDGKLQLGAIDRLLPASSGGPVTLPRLRVDLADARMDLETPQGQVALALKGEGRLDDGFAGRLTAASARIQAGGCVARQVAADVAIRIDAARPSARGPVKAHAISCGESLAWEPEAELAVALDAAFTRWRGQARLDVQSLQLPGVLAEPLGGTMTFDGTAARTSGSVDLRAGRLSADAGGGRDVALAGRYEIGARAGFEGRISSPSVALGADGRRALAALGESGQGTPVAPLLAQFARAAVAAARGGRIDAALSLATGEGGGTARVSRMNFAGASGASLQIEGGDGVSLRWPGGGTRIDATLTTRGGGLPEMAVRLAQSAPGAPIQGTAFVQPYAVGGARLELATVRFTAGEGGITRVSTQATLSGPLSGGRVDRLVVPIEGRWDGRGLIVNPGCAPMAFDRLRVSSLVLDRTRLTVCPTRTALFALRDGAVSGGARVGAFRLGGRIGGSPLALTAASGSFDFAGQRFALGDLGARIGSESVTLLDVARLDGRIDGGGVAGTFAGAGGTIGSVPLRMSEGAGNWRLESGRLALDGGLRVADTAEAPRFHPLASDDVRLTLIDSRIDATATLRTPEGGLRVADVTLTHDLNAGSGSADLGVLGITFVEGGLQPNDLTRLTFGVIAAVNGTVSGQGHIRWDQAGVTSDGVFRTDRADLAAAFGQVTGLATEIRFADLLNMRTEPAQVATVAGINPGVPVENGTIRYRLLDSTRVQVESGRWPFAGGVLELEPTLLDFSEARERRMTFRLIGVDAGQFLQEMEFTNINATGVFDGVLPMVFDARGGRIENGRLQARAQGGSIAYIGELTQRDLGYWGNLAFQALKSLNYRNLDLEMNGSLSGDMVTEIRFAGVSQGEGAKSNFLIRRLQRLPFEFNITVRAPFRQLLESVQSYYDPTRLIQRNLPALLDEQERRRQQPIQPSESETVP